MYAPPLHYDPFTRLPDLLGRLPLPSEVWARAPEPLHRLAALRHRLPRLTARQLFAAVVPAGLLLGWLISFAVDPDVIQRGGKPYIERLEDGVRVELPRLAYAYDGFPEDPAPFGYGEAPSAEFLSAGIAEAGQYAETVDAAPQAAPVADGQVLAQGDGRVPLVAAADGDAAPKPAIKVVPQDTPL